MGVQNEGSPRAYSQGGKNENTYSKWVFKMRGRPERKFKGKNEYTYSKWVFKMRGRPDRILKRGKWKRLY